MKKSLTYKITLLVLKLKGVKKIFSQDPINYKKIRKEDIKTPKKSLKTLQTKILKTHISSSSFGDQKKERLLIFIHGGAFISGPVKHHWDSFKKISEQVNTNVWMCDYPKAPEHTISEITTNIDAVYQKALALYAPENIYLLGDSVGGTLCTALVQRLLTNNIPVPKKIILISPVMDATLSNPDIDNLDLLDPILSKKGVLSAKKMCAQNTSLKDPKISPLYGSFKSFPETTLFLATHDITYPDQVLALAKMKEQAINLRVIIGEEMPHIWPLLPVMKEAKVAFKILIEELH